MVVVFSVVMMMKVAVNREEEEEDAKERVVVEQTKWNKSKKITPIHRVVVSMLLSFLSLSFSFSCVCIRATSALPQPLGYITRRDLYSRLTSLCEGRIHSDTSLVRTRTIRLCYFPSFSLFLSFCSLVFSGPPSPVRSSGDFTTATTRTRPYRHFRHPRDSTRAQLDGSNWTANDRTVIRINTHTSPLSPIVVTRRYVA